MTTNGTHDLYHIELRSLVKKRSIFGHHWLLGHTGEKDAPDTHQLVQHVIGTREQCREVEEGFMHQCELFVNGLNARECKRGVDGEFIKPKYLCNGFVTRTISEFDWAPIIIELPSVLEGC